MPAPAAPDEGDEENIDERSFCEERALGEHEDQGSDDQHDRTAQDGRHQPERCEHSRGHLEICLVDQFGNIPVRVPVKGLAEKIAKALVHFKQILEIQCTGRHR